MAQLVARPTPDRKVGSSILSGLMFFFFESGSNRRRHFNIKAVNDLVGYTGIEQRHVHFLDTRELESDPPDRGEGASKAPS